MRRCSSSAIHATDSIERLSIAGSDSVCLSLEITACLNARCSLGGTDLSKMKVLTLSIASRWLTLRRAASSVLAHTEKAVSDFSLLHSAHTAARLTRVLVEPTPFLGTIWSISQVLNVIGDSQYRHVPFCLWTDSQRLMSDSRILLSPSCS